MKAGMTRTPLLISLALATGLSLGQAHAAAKTVYFPHNAESKHMAGTLEGPQMAEYHLALHQGQELSVLCHSRKRSVSFFVKDPAGHLLYTTADGGLRNHPLHDHWHGRVPENGNYTVGVFLHHGTERKGQNAFYKLNLSAH
ncbi:hypothetical protein AtDm6_0913 [Acetobacter tropicalis]|uniref:Uncharacterized protein n=2 Tax=Acetobacter tropicalis TaxID=104102 RepID=A0A094YV16_9PROT|nr:hypothetical protein AtDm6_0913 [Acetobacter tropicalis]KXV48713.1 hypothetical protein AD944_09530 [Acetobacter tropicalis]KXV59168.1 hypothetical protein AD947_04555 [Acetobacter tropicalis]